MRRGGERRQDTQSASTQLCLPLVTQSSRTRPSLDPRDLHTSSSLTSRENVKSGAGARVSRLGKPVKAGGTTRGVLATNRRCAARPGSPRSVRLRDASETGRRSWPSSREETRARVWCPYVVVVAEVGRQNLASNKLPRSTPKRVTVGVNGGLARRRRPQGVKRRANRSL